MNILIQTLKKTSLKKTFQVFVVFSAIILVQTACGTISTSHEATGKPAIVKELIKSTQSWDGELLPYYPQGQPRITILRITIPAGTRLEMHKHPVINAGVLITGQLTVVAKNGKTFYLKAGDPIVELVNAQHYGINEGKIPAEIIVFYAGTTDRPITVVDPR